MSVFWFATSVVKVCLGVGTKTACLSEQMWPVTVSNSPSRLPLYEVLQHCNDAPLLPPSVLSSFVHRSRIAHVRKIWSFYEFEQTDGLVFLRGNDPLINSQLMQESPAYLMWCSFNNDWSQPHLCRLKQKCIRSVRCMWDGRLKNVREASAVQTGL